MCQTKQECQWHRTDGEVTDTSVIEEHLHTPNHQPLLLPPKQLHLKFHSGTSEHQRCDNSRRKTHSTSIPDGFALGIWQDSSPSLALEVSRVDRAPHEHHSDGWTKRHGTQWCKLKTELEGKSWGPGSRSAEIFWLAAHGSLTSDCLPVSLSRHAFLRLQTYATCKHYVPNRIAAVLNINTVMILQWEVRSRDTIIKW